MINTTRYEQIKDSPFFKQEMEVLNSLPDGKEYYDYIVDHIDLDRTNPKNSYFMYAADKVDHIDLTKPCQFTKASTALPDIDVDFPTNYRDKAIDYVKEKYGADKVCQISTYGRLSGRSAIKAVMRTEGTYDFDTMNAVTDGIPDEAAISDQLEDTGEHSIISWVLQYDPDKISNYCRLEDDQLVGDYADVFRKAIALEGVFQNQGKHAAGVIISSEKISDVSPMCLSKDSNRIAAMDMGDLEKMGLVKFDFLGVDILNKIQEAYGTDIINAPLDDEEVWDLLKEGNTKGCFQVESHLGKEWCMQIRPESIEELAAISATIRPGCVSGDTKVSRLTNHSGHIKKHHTMIKISDLYKVKKRRKNVLTSMDNEGNIINNKIVDVFYTGKKECFTLNLRRYKKGKSNSSIGMSNYNLECTIEHKLFTPSGWKELKDIRIGERIAARKFTADRKLRASKASNRHVKGLRHHTNVLGSRFFSDICYKNYYEKCCICGYDKFLDTNHIYGNRLTNNSPENLCFLCPNCHREYSLGLIPVEYLIAKQKDNRLPNLTDFEWTTLEDIKSVGIKDVYDIAMEGPHHNFIAGNVLVHNCLMSKSEDGRAMPKVFADRKNGLESVEDTPINKVIDTYGIIIYQETLLKIAKQIAGFNSAESIAMMKSIGKKNAKLLFSLEEKFVNGCTKKNIITKEEAISLFHNIKNSARYLFNKSHAISYAYPGYWSAYIKKHKPLQFYKTWLKYSDHKLDPHAEVRNLVLSARGDHVEIAPPSCKYLTKGFFIEDNQVIFGLTHIKGVSEHELDKLFDLMKTYGLTNVVTYLTCILPHINKRTVESLIKCGCFSFLGIARTALLHYYECFSDFSKKELEFFKERSYDSPINAAIDAAKLKKEGGACATSARVPKVQQILEKMTNPGRSLQDTPAIIATNEENLIGIPLSCSYMDQCMSAGLADTTCLEFKRGKPGKVTIVARVKDIKEHTCKNEKIMSFLSIEDDTAELDNVVCFADQYELYKGILYNGAFVSIFGERGKGKSLVINRAVEI